MMVKKRQFIEGFTCAFAKLNYLHHFNSYEKIIELGIAFVIKLRRYAEKEKN